MEPGVKGRVPIVRHPDVRRMLMLHQIEDRSDARAGKRSGDVARCGARYIRTGRSAPWHQAFADLMIPVVKGWCTENSVASSPRSAIQVHGGMGFIEETGRRTALSRCAHHADLRRHHRHPGKRSRSAASSRATAAALRRPSSRRCANSARRSPRNRASAGRVACFPVPSTRSSRAVHYVVSSYGKDVRGVSAGAVPLLELFGVVAGGWQLLRSALVARDRLASPPAQGAASAGFYRAKIDDGALLCRSCAVAGTRTCPCDHRGICRGARRGRAVAAP